MNNHRNDSRPHRRGSWATASLALCGALLAGCGGGGGGLLAADESATQAEREQAALRRAMEMNATVLGRVKGERAARGG